MQSATRSNNRTIIIVSAGVLMLIVIAALFIRAFQPPVPLAKLNSLKPGMTQSDVRKILGEPTVISPGGRQYEVRGIRYITDDGWTYQRPLTFGFVNIHFDAKRLFTDYDYEEF